MAVDVRVLHEGDEYVLDGVAADVFDEPIDAGAVREFLRDPHHHIAVAIDDGVVVGFASAVHYVHPDKPRPEMWINEVGVAPTHQRRGIARDLLTALFGAGRELGCTEAWVLTERSNGAAMALYASASGEWSAEDEVMFTFRLTT